MTAGMSSWLRKARLREAREKVRAFLDGTSDVCAQHRPAHAQDDVEGLDRRTRAAHAFAQPPPQPVAIDSAAHHLARDDVADAARGLCRRRDDQLQERAVVARPSPEQRFERLRAAKAVAGRRQTGCRNGRQTDSRARPFARRADRTLRPPTVFMRARKPCVRARRIFDG